MGGARKEGQASGKRECGREDGRVGGRVAGCVFATRLDVGHERKKSYMTLYCTDSKSMFPTCTTYPGMSFNGSKHEYL